jgi:hypothetical protein
LPVEMPPDDGRTGANVKDLTAHRRTRIRAVPDPQPPADDDYGAWIGYADEVQEDPTRFTGVDASAVGSAPSGGAVSPTRPDDVLKQFATPPASLPEPGPPPPELAVDDTQPLREDRAGTDADVKDTSETEDDTDVADTAPGRVDDSVPMWAGTGAHPVMHRQATPRGSAELAPAAKSARKRSPARIAAEPPPRTRAREMENRDDELTVRRRRRPSLPLRPRGVPRAGWILAAVVLLAVGIVSLGLEGSTSNSRTPRSSAYLKATTPRLPEASHLTNGPTLLSAFNIAEITQTGSRIVGKSITRYEAARRAATRRRAAEQARRHRQLLARRRAKARRAQQHRASKAASSSGSAATYTPPNTTSAAATATSATTTPTYTPTTPSYTPPAQTSTPSSSSSSSQPAGPTGAGTQSGDCDPICK